MAKVASLHSVLKYNPYHDSYGRFTTGNSYTPRQQGEGDKDYAKRVVDKLPSPMTLPSGDLSRYFKNLDQAKVVSIDDLESTKTDVENAQGLENGPKRLRAAYDGIIGKRDPISA